MEHADRRHERGLDGVVVAAVGGSFDGVSGGAAAAGQARGAHGLTGPLDRKHVREELRDVGQAAKP